MVKGFQVGGQGVHPPSAHEIRTKCFIHMETTLFRSSTILISCANGGWTSCPPDLKAFHHYLS
ncbi:hypothetical protein COLO4_08304 [Corchorus olitorius]|uniref:Uncharacterized protein n=1 Tax=Corchorus olitorius TaxID=93759 RepID=A0A1R3KGG5_9ROSI|nr:hypothetical protein COLO4_08304 [Corchorus olitorius]